MYLGDLTDNDVIIMGQQALPQDITSGDSQSDSDTMDASDLNRQAQAQHDARANTDDEDDAPHFQHGRRTRFHYSESFGEDQEQEEGDAEEDGSDHPDDDINDGADASPPHPPNRGTRLYREAGPSIQEPIKNFVDTDYPEDAGIWKLTATYPTDNVKVRDLAFTRSPASDRPDG